MILPLILLVLISAIVAWSLWPGISEARQRRDHPRAELHKPDAKSEASSRLRDIEEEMRETRTVGIPAVDSATQARRQYDILHFDATYPVWIVVPTFEYEGRDLVLRQDLIAVEAVARLIASGPQKNLDVSIAPSEIVHFPTRDNLITICTGRRNILTNEVLSHDDVRSILPFEFLKINVGGTDFRYAIRFDGETFQSQMYDQELARNADPTGYAGGFDDYAILAKFPSPWNGNASILLVAGIRAMGTAGAGEFLEKHYDELLRQFESKNFAVLLKVRAPDVDKPQRLDIDLVKYAMI